MLRILLLGTGPFAVPSLQSLHASQHEVVCAISRPPRGRKPLPAPVQLAAEELGIEVWLPETVNSDEARGKLASYDADLLVVCDYGEILKSSTLASARLGGINLHGSLLPKYRGAAPVQWAILKGDQETGNTIIQMTPGLDAGPCLAIQRIAIDPDETSAELEPRMANLGGQLTLQVVDQLAAGTATPLEQDKALATKAPRLTKEQGLIDWSQPACQIKNQVRALQPWPRAYTHWCRSNEDPLRLIVHRVSIEESFDTPQLTSSGKIVNVDSQLLVATGDGFLRLEEIQPAGKRKMSAEDFLRGQSVQVGDQLS